MHRAEAEIGDRVEDALLGELLGGREQPPGGGALGAHPRQTGDLGGDLGHLRGRLQVALTGATVDVPLVERDQAAGGVQDVGDGGVLATGVPHRVGEHDWGVLLVGPAEHAGREGGRPPRRSGAAVVDDLAHHRGDLGAPPPPPVGGEVGASGGEQPTDVGVGTEQHDEGTLGGGVLTEVVGDQRGVDGGAAAASCCLGAGMRGGDQPAQRRPPLRPTGEDGDPGQPGVDAPAPPGGSTGAGRRCARHGDGLEGEISAEHRCDPGGKGGPGETHRAPDAVAVGETEDAQPLVGGDGDQGLR